jgi:Family of unknown function (DUF6174)
MKRNAFFSLGLCAGGIFLLGCSGTIAKKESPTTRTALTNAQAKWKARGVKSYEYVFQRSAFGPPESTRKVRVRVDNGATTSVIAADTNTTPISRILFDNYDTVEKIFDRVNEKIVVLPDKLDLTFDASYGYLNSLVFDRSTAIADEEETYTISEFKTL